LARHRLAPVQKLAKTTNGVNVDDLFTTIDSIKATPGRREIQIPHSQPVGGGQPKSLDRGHVLRRLPGAVAAANPVEHPLHALADCLTRSMVYHAGARDIHIEIEEVESSLAGDIDLRGFLELDRNVGRGYQGIRVNFKIKANAPGPAVAGNGRAGNESLPGVRFANQPISMFLTVPHCSSLVL
jgi:hypothetical protein